MDLLTLGFDIADLSHRFSLFFCIFLPRYFLNIRISRKVNEACRFLNINFPLLVTSPFYDNFQEVFRNPVSRTVHALVLQPIYLTDNLEILVSFVSLLIGLCLSPFKGVFNSYSGIVSYRRCL